MMGHIPETSNAWALPVHTVLTPARGGGGIMTRDASATTGDIEVNNAALRISVKVMPWIPPWLKRLLAGGRRLTIDGNTLDPTLQLLLAIQRRSRTGGLSAADDLEVVR